ncbi:MAG: hypothetical protein AB7P69_08910 [Candidatus Binatia bacterium]
MLNKQVKQEEDGLPEVALTLQFQGSSVDVPLEQAFEQEDRILFPQYLLGVSLLETFRDADECLGKRLLTDVVKKPKVIV